MIERPDLWASYIWPAYILTIGGLAALLIWSYLSMRNAEKRADRQNRK
jgi:heme exporter protein CcmD